MASLVPHVPPVVAFDSVVPAATHIEDVPVIVPAEGTGLTLTETEVSDDPQAVVIV